MQTSLSRRERPDHGNRLSPRRGDGGRDPRRHRRRSELSTVRALLRVLVEKGHLQQSRGWPALRLRTDAVAAEGAFSALAQLVNTFFDGSASQAVSALLGSSQTKLSRSELDELSALIEAARAKGALTMWTQFLAIALKTSLLMSAAGVASAMLAGKSAALRHLVWVSALVLALLMPFATVLCRPMPSCRIPGVERSNSRPLLRARLNRSPSLHSRLMKDSAERLAEAAWPAVLAVWLREPCSSCLRDVAGHAGLSRWGPPRASRCARRIGRAALRPHGRRAARHARAGNPITSRALAPGASSGRCWCLPAAALDWSEERRRYALTHELAHIGRGDYFSASIARLACAMHWYNPLVWYAASQAHKLQECACDDAVLRAGGVASEYAQLLVDVAARSAGVCGSLRPAMGMAQCSPLHDRVKAIPRSPAEPRAEHSRVSGRGHHCAARLHHALLASATLAEPAKIQPVEPVRVHTQPLAAAATVSDVKPVERVPMRRHRAYAVVRPVTAAPDVASLPAPRSLARPSGDTADTRVARNSSTPSIKPVPPVPAVPAVPGRITGTTATELP